MEEKSLGNYAPKGKYLWDPWFKESGDKLHMWHLQSDRDHDPNNRHHDNISIGHAIFENGFWHTVSDSLKPGEEGTWDEVSLWTGSVSTVGDTECLFYTGLSKKPDEYWIQRIGMATSKDPELIHWQKDPRNPILLADNHYYHMNNSKNKLGVVPAFRDPFAFKETPSNKNYLLFTARAFDQSPEYNGCIGIAEASGDLSSFPLLHPLLSPHLYDEMEVPQMILHEGKYYLFFSCAANFINTSWAPDLKGKQVLSAFYSNELFGTYQQVNGNGVVWASEVVRGLRLIKKDSTGYKALGWLDSDGKNGLIGRLSDEKHILINGDRIEVR